MRDKWFSDNRDLVKWSCLLLLARRAKVDRIIHIAFYTPSEFADVEIDGTRYQIPYEVLSSFRDIRNASTLSREPTITVFDTPFRDRDSYLQAALSFIASFRNERSLVVLDPDTGLQPRGKPATTHVLNSEVQKIWEAIRPGCVYVLYQHETNKAGRPWIDEKRLQFANAIGVDAKKVGIGAAPKIAKDVVLYHITKT